MTTPAHENKQIVFENEAFYKDDHDKEQEFHGILQKVPPPTLPPGSGVGPQVTQFYQLLEIIAPKIPDRPVLIYSHGTTNSVLDTYINWEVKLTGKLTQNQLWPGYIVPIKNTVNPGGPISGGGGTVQPGGPIEFTVFADQAWYKEDKDRVQEWTGTLQPYTQFNIPPGGGPGPVVTLFYQLSVYFRPPIILSENIVIYSHNHKNAILDQFLNKGVRIIGKYHDGQIWPGYLLPWSPSPLASTEPSASSGTTNAAAAPAPAQGSSSGSSNIVEPRITVFANDAAYQSDPNPLQDWKGKLGKYEQFKLPPGSGVGPQVTLFYKIDVVYAPQLPIVERIIYSDNTTNPILDKYLNHEVFLIGKITNKNEIYPGYLIPLLELPPGTVSHTTTQGTTTQTQPAGPIEYLVFATQKWYEDDKDKVQEWTGILQPYTEFKLPPGTGVGPVVTLFYQLQIYVANLSEHIIIYSHNSKNDILDKFLTKSVRIIGKLHDNQIWPGFLLPYTPIPPPPPPHHGGAYGHSGAAHIVEPKITVFADEKSYKDDHNKQQEWRGKLLKYEQFKLPPGSGVGPQVTLFYKIDVVYAPQLPIVERIIYSDNTTNATLDKYLNHEVLLIGKVTNQNEIYPGYLVPQLNIPPGTVSHGTHHGGPIEYIVFADQQWYKEDKDKVQEWTGTIQPYSEFNISSGGGPGPVVTLFYQLHVYFKPPIILEENIVIYSDKHKNAILDQFLNKEVRIIGKLHDSQIWPGFLLPWSPATAEHTSSSIVEPKITVFADEANYKKDANKQQDWKGKLLKYEQFKLPPGSGVGPQVTLFYKIEVVYAPQLPIVEKIIYSDNTTNPILDKYLNHDVLLIGKIINDNEIYPGYLVPILTTNPNVHA